MLSLLLSSAITLAAALPSNHPARWAYDVARQAEQSPTAAAQLIKDRLEQQFQGRTRQSSAKTLKNKFDLQEEDGAMDWGTLTPADGSKVQAVDASTASDPVVGYFTVSGWTSDYTLMIESTNDCGTFSVKSGFLFSSGSEMDTDDIGEGWVNEVPACVLKSLGTGGTLYYVVSVDEGTPACSLTVTISEMASPCNEEQVSTAASSSMVTLGLNEWYFIDYTAVISSGKLVSLDWDQTSMAMAHSFAGSMLSSPTTPFAVTKDYQARWGFKSMMENTNLTWTVSQSDFTCADGKAIRDANTDTDNPPFPLCKVDYKFVGYDADPFEGFLAFLAMMGPACYDPMLAASCADLYPPCDANNLAKTLCSKAICQGLLACANSLSPGSISGDQADEYCASNTLLNTNTLLGDENGTKTAIPVYSTASSCSAVPLCADTCGVAALRPALMMMIFVALNTLKNLL